MSRPRPLVAVVGLLAVAVLVASIVTIAVRTGRSSSSTHRPAVSGATPAQVSTAYYGDLHDQNASAAFALLCPGQQQQGEGMFAQTLGLDSSSGTGISSFVLTGDTVITTDGATVPADITLDNGQAVPIQVLLTYGATGWQVCSSDLGGVLPAPGSSAAPSSSV